MSLSSILAQMDCDNSYTIWSDSDTAALVKAYKIYLDGIVIDNKKGWHAVTAQLHKQGVYKTVNQIRKKWANLMRRYVAHSRPNAPNIKFKFYNEIDEMLGHKDTPGGRGRKSNIGMKADSLHKWVIGANSLDSIEEGIRSNEMDSHDDETEEMCVESEPIKEQAKVQRNPMRDRRSIVLEQRTPAIDQWITMQEQKTPVKDNQNTVQERKSVTKDQWTTVLERRHPVKDQRNTVQDERRLTKEQNKKTYVNVVPIETLMDDYVSSDSSPKKTVQKRKTISAKEEYYEAKKMFIEDENRRREANIRDRIRCRNEKNQILKAILEAVFFESE